MILKYIIKKHWKFTLNESYRFFIPNWNKSNPVHCYDKNHKIWATVYPDGDCEVYRGYSWDGCTPKYIILNRWVIGTSDGKINKTTNKPILYYPSLNHDVLCQFKNILELDQWDIDNWFMSDMKYHKVGELRSLFYYVSVRLWQIINS